MTKRDGIKNSNENTTGRKKKEKTWRFYFVLKF